MPAMRLSRASACGTGVLHEEELELQNKLGSDAHFHVISFGFKSPTSTWP